jgi:hypothetical protein
MKYRSLLLLTGLSVCLSASACNNAPPSSTNSAPTPSPERSPAPTPSASLPTKVDPKQLIDRIKQLQTEYVRDSTGTEADQCFTDDDFKQFNSDRKPAEIVERLQKDNDFKRLVSAIRDIDSSQREDLLNKASNTYRKPWSELRLNPTTASAEELRKGQTKAGSEAEKSIARTVVDLVRRMI